MTLLNDDTSRRILHHLLDRAASGRITRRNGTPWVDGAPGNLLQQICVSIIDKQGWLIWWPEANGSCCCLSRAGDEVLRQWDAELFGPAEPVFSDRPLLNPPCLDDAIWTPEAERRLMHMIFEVTPEDLELPE